MSAVEEIQQAIDTLVQLKAERGYFEVNGWLAEEAQMDPGHSPLYPSEPGMAPITNDPLLVILHRTIDPQLKILRTDLKLFEAYRKDGAEHIWLSAVMRGGDLDLAREINRSMA